MLVPKKQVGHFECMSAANFTHFQFTHSLERQLWIDPLGCEPVSFLSGNCTVSRNSGMVKASKKYFCRILSARSTSRTIGMQQNRTYRRCITENRMLFTIYDRVNRVLLRLSERIVDLDYAPPLDELLVLCQELSPTQCLLKPKD